MPQESLRIGPKYDGFLFLAEAARNPPKLDAHTHAELEFNLVVEGELAYLVDGRRYVFPKRSLFWLFPDQSHQLVHRSNDAKYYVAVFKPEMTADACRHSHRELGSSSPPVSDHVCSCVLSPNLFEQLCGAMNALTAGGLDAETLNREAGYGVSNPEFTFTHHDPDWLNAGLRHLLLWGWRAQLDAGQSIRTQEIHPSIQRALELLLEDEEDFDLGQLASRCDVSESYLSRLFRRELGLTLTNYRNNLRLSRYWERLRNHPQESTLQAAISAGFGSYAQFYRVYQSTYGESPRQTRGRPDEDRAASDPEKR